MSSYNSIINKNTELQNNTKTKNRTEDQSAEWKSFREKLGKNSTINTVNKNLNKAVTVLEKINGYLETTQDMLEMVNSVAQLFAVLESLVASTAWVLLNFLITQIETILQDFESSGVYVLECFRQYLSAQEQKYLGMEVAKVDGMWTDITSNNNGTEGNIIDFYRSTTYYEFIDDIVNRFYDENDTPELPKDSSKWFQATLYPGRPIFSSGSMMYGGMLLFAVPDAEEAAVKVKHMISFIGEIAKSIYNYNPSKDIDDALNRVKKLKDFFDPTDYVNAYNKFDLNARREKTIRPRYPFFGTNLYSLCPKLFDGLDNIVKLLKSWANADPFKDTGMIKSIQKKIEGIINDIENIQEMVDNISYIIETIEAILAFTDFFVIGIKTNLGVEGFLDQLRNATGLFDDKKMTQLLLSYGIPEDYVNEFVGMKGNEIRNYVNKTKDELKQEIDSAMKEVDEALKVMEESNKMFDAVVNIAETQIKNYKDGLLAPEYKSLLAQIITIESNYDSTYAALVSNRKLFLDTNVNYTIETFQATKERLEKEIITTSIQYDANEEPINIDIYTWTEKIKELTKEKQAIQTKLDIYLLDPAGLEIEITNAQSKISAIDSKINDLNKSILELTNSNNYEIELIDKKIDVPLMKKTILEGRFALNDRNYDYQGFLNGINSYIDLLTSDLESAKTDLVTAQTNFDTYSVNTKSQITALEQENEELESEISARQSELDWAQERAAYYAQNPPSTPSEIEENNRANSIVALYPGDIQALQTELDNNTATITTLSIELTNATNAYFEIKQELNESILTKFDEKLICGIYVQQADYDIKMFLNRYDKNKEIEIIENEIDLICETLKTTHLKFMTLADSNAYVQQVYIELQKFGFDPDSRVLHQSNEESLILGPVLAVKRAQQDLKTERTIRYTNAVEKLAELNNKKDKFDNIELDVVDNIDEMYDHWNPNAKMYYGGILICAGVPHKDGYELLNWNTDMQTIFKDQVKFAKEEFVDNNEDQIQDAQELWAKSKSGFDRLKNVWRKYGIG